MHVFIAVIICIVGLTGCANIYYAPRPSVYDQMTVQCDETNKRMCQDEYDDYFSK